MEQLTLLLILCSCIYKGNIVSLIYMPLIFMYLQIKNKGKGMLIMSVTFGLTLAI